MRLRHRQRLGVMIFLGNREWLLKAPISNLPMVWWFLSES